MNIIINMTTCSCKRNHIFLESLPLLKELIQHLQGIIHDLKEDCLWVGESPSVKRLGQAGLDVDTILDCDEGMPLEIVGTVRQSFGKPGAPLLILSPFLGVISASRVKGFLENCSQEAASASTFAINGNANPFWLTMIDPRSRHGDDHYIDVHDSVLPRLSPKPYFCNITNGKAWTQFFKDRNVYGSQWLPPVKMLDLAMIFDPVASNGEMNPVYCETVPEDSLPLLYRLPIFDFAKNEHLFL